MKKSGILLFLLVVLGSLTGCPPVQTTLKVDARKDETPSKQETPKKTP